MGGKGILRTADRSPKKKKRMKLGIFLVKINSKFCSKQFKNIYFFVIDFKAWLFVRVFYVLKISFSW